MGTTTNSSQLEVDLRAAIKSGNISNLMVVDISQHAIAMKQNYVKEVINTINLKPPEFNLTAEQFCDVFDVCQYTTVVISSSTEKFGLDLQIISKTSLAKWMLSLPTPILLKTEFFKDVPTALKLLSLNKKLPRVVPRSPKPPRVLRQKTKMTKMKK